MIPEDELRRIPKDLSDQARPLRLRNAKVVKLVFADTLYWIALFVPGGSRSEGAIAVDLCFRKNISGWRPGVPVG